MTFKRHARDIVTCCETAFEKKRLATDSIHKVVFWLEYGDIEKILNKNGDKKNITVVRSHSLASGYFTFFTDNSLTLQRCTTHVQSYCTGLETCFFFSNTFVIDVFILSKFPDTLATISPYTVKNSNLIHFIGQIRALGPLCSDPSWGWQVALKGSPQGEFHGSTARDTIKLDGLPETSCVREIHFCFCSN